MLRSLLVVCVLCACGSGPTATPSDVPDAGPGTTPTADAAPTPPPDDAELRRFIGGQMSAAHVPGLAACIAKRGAIAWCGGFGDANIEAGTAVTPDTPFLVASVSKTVTVVALMQVLEDGAFALDDDIAAALPFSAAHPNHASTPITYRHLLTHTASIEDNWGTMEQWYAVGTDPTIALGDAMQRYLSPAGADYDAAGNFYDYAPGAQWNYSNVGVALAGHLLERLTGDDFSDYCAANIFDPAGMADTSWRLADFGDLSTLAMPYAWTGAAFEAAGHYTFADYPSGALRTSARDLARFLIAVHAADLLAPATVDDMLRPHVPDVQADQALVWFLATIDGDTWVTHSGGELGVATIVMLRPRDGLGIVLLMNGDAEPYAPIEAIIDRLLAFAAAL